MSSVWAGLNSASPNLGDRIEALRAELLAQLELLSWETSGVARHDPASDYVFELAPESPTPLSNE